MADKHPSRNCHVPTGLHWQARFFAASASFWKKLAGFESTVLREDIAAVPIEQPIYIAGVPRAGSTLLTELLAEHPAVTSHRYSDFPNIFTPYWRNWLAERTRRHAGQPVERAHRDRIRVTRESPEAVEEVIWMQFFDALHDVDASQVLGKTTTNPAFELFYRDHIRKLLRVRGASRYLAKGNYNATRLAYLHKLFPDARFIVPVRDPVGQVASLVKQDRLFRQASAEDPRVPRQLAMSGHCEFGPDKRAVHAGDDETTRRIIDEWASGRDVAGWARYWSSVYARVLDTLEHEDSLRRAVRLVHYKTLCHEPEATIRVLLSHCRLETGAFEDTLRRYATHISEPDYYSPEFSGDELEQITTICRPTASRLGYDL